MAMPGGPRFRRASDRPAFKRIQIPWSGVFHRLRHDRYVTADQLIGSQVYFDVVSVGATINVLLAAVRAKGLTIIENAAKEPHIVDLANFLNSMGAEIMGAGTERPNSVGLDSSAFHLLFDYSRSD